jgi:hypothetical protein
MMMMDAGYEVQSSRDRCTALLYSVVERATCGYEDVAAC